jgi:hypothetical protein
VLEILTHEPRVSNCIGCEDCQQSVVSARTMHVANSDGAHGDNLLHETSRDG